MGVHFSVCKLFCLPAQDKPPCPVGFSAETQSLVIGPLWPYVLSGPTPALLPLLLSPEMQPHPFLNAGRPSVPATLMFALPLGHLISLQAWVLSLSSLTNLHSHPVKTTETFKGFPMPHWGFRHLLPPSKAWCRSYSMVPTP